MLCRLPSRRPQRACGRAHNLAYAGVLIPRAGSQVGAGKKSGKKGSSKSGTKKGKKAKSDPSEAAFRKKEPAPLLGAAPRGGDESTHPVTAAAAETATAALAAHAAEPMVMGGSLAAAVPQRTTRAFGRCCPWFKGHCRRRPCQALFARMRNKQLPGRASLRPAAIGGWDEDARGGGDHEAFAAGTGLDGIYPME